MSSTKKITQFAPGQEQRLTQVYQEWLAIGRSTSPLDRQEVTAILTEFYSRIGKPAPTVLFFSSPAMCILAWAAQRGLGESQLESQLGSQLGSQLWSQLESQLESQLGSQLGSQLWSQLESQLESQLRSQLESQLGSQLWSQLWSQLESQLRSQLESQLRSQLESQLRSQLESQLRSQLGSQLESQLRSQLESQLESQLRSQLESQLRNRFAGQHWCAWDVFYAFCGEIGVRYTADETALLDLWLRQSRGLHWWFPYEGIVLASERHTICSVDDRGRLHAPAGLACGYSDGWGVYSWHGVLIPERYYLEDVSAREILAERNAEVRRALIERYDEARKKGRFLLDCGATVIDSAVQPMRPGQPEQLNELLAIDLPDDPEQRIVALRVVDPSTSRQYIIRVPPDQTTVRGALAWSFNVPEKEYVLQQES